MPVRMIPLLPCGSIEEMAEFGAVLGMRVTHRQVRPNPYLALERDDGLVLHYYELPGVVPEDSHSSCVVVVDEIEPVFSGLAAGLRDRYGKLPLSGHPRITRPRRRKNNDQRTGFSLVDPAGNWIRFTAARPDRPPPAHARTAGSGPLQAALDNAVVLADSRGAVAQAHKILAGAVRRYDATADAASRQQAEGYLSELELRLAWEQSQGHG